MITGGAGFPGPFVGEKIVKERGIEPQKIIISRRKDCDLRVWKNCLGITKKVDIVIHLAAKVGGLVLIRRTQEVFFMTMP